MNSSLYTTYSVSPNGRIHLYWVRDREGYVIATVKSVDNGETWRISGLFPEPKKSFTNSQEAIEQACYLFANRETEWADRELMATF